MSSGKPADFAMLRAVDILSNLHRVQRSKAPPVELLATPAVLRSPRIAFEVGKTQRAQVEGELGIAFSYPARGWHTYATRENGRRCFLSAFYKDSILLAVELYVPSVQRAPALAPANLGGFQLEPCGICIGVDGSRALEARFEGGAVYVKAQNGIIARIAIYGDGAAPV